MSAGMEWQYVASSRKDRPVIIDSGGLNLVKRLLRDKSGLIFDGVQLEMLINKLENRMRVHRMRTLSDYYFFLRYASGGREELNLLVDSITINETYFFRNSKQFDFLEKKALPELIEQRMNKGQFRLRAWSAGCSSGEEPYSISMCILDAFSTSDTLMKSIIFASDINRQILETARRRIYDKWSLRHMPPDKKIKYMHRADEDDKFIVDKKVSDLVMFEQRNLLSVAGVTDPIDLDVIFCRNVLIYFDSSDLPGILDRFYDALRPGGYLLLGHSESLHSITGAFDIVLQPGVVAYRKAPES